MPRRFYSVTKIKTNKYCNYQNPLTVVNADPGGREVSAVGQ